MKASIITTCKGRLHHLMQTLPAMVTQTGFTVGKDYEVILVDYNDPDFSASYAEKFSAPVTVYRLIEGGEKFNHSHARNIGGVRARGSVLCFVDADVKLVHGWLETALCTMDAGPDLLVCDGNQRGATGTCAVLADAFMAVRGYAEELCNWGFEDCDFYRRVEEAGYKKQFFPSCLMEVIQHSNEERIQFRSEWRLNISNAVNKRISLARTGIVNKDGFGEGKVEAHG